VDEVVLCIEKRLDCELEGVRMVLEAYVGDDCCGLDAERDDVP